MRASVGRYRVLTSLGRGGMAEVYLTTAGGSADGAASKLLVVKCIRPELMSESDLLGMFLDEARLALRLNHPNVVQTFEVDVVEGEPFLAMEYLDGQPLNRLLHRERQQPDTLPLGVKLRIVIEGLRGLHYAHELSDYDGVALGVVHRDVSPHNLFVTYDGATKVVDFGIAKAARRTQETRTGAGTPKGKVRYMAPEQARGEKVDRRADVFAMGVVLWELITGRRLWEDRDDMDVLYQLFQSALPSLAMADIDPALIELCTRAMSVKPEGRFDSASEFSLVLERYLSEHGLHAETSDVSTMMRKLFVAEQQQMAEVIRQALGRGEPLFLPSVFRGGSGLTPSGHASNPGLLPAGSLTGSATGLSRSSLPNLDLEARNSLTETAIPQPARRPPLWALGVGLVALGLAGFAWSRHEAASMPMAAASAASLGSAPIATSTASVVAPVAPAASASVATEPSARVPAASTGRTKPGKGAPPPPPTTRPTAHPTAPGPTAPPLFLP